MKTVQFLTSIIAGSALLLAACAPQGATIAVAVKETRIVVKETQVVKKTAAEAAPTYTANPEPPCPTFSKDLPIQTALIPEDKPSVKMKTESPEFAARHTIGFVAPDGQTALKLGALPELREDPNGMYVVGVIEASNGAKLLPVESRLLLSIDLVDADSPVSGRLWSTDGKTSKDLDFKRTQLVKSDRSRCLGILPEPPPISAAIRSDGVCLMVEFPKQSGAYWRYCSAPGSILSVKQNFAKEYADQSVLQITQAYDNLAQNGYLTNQKIDPANAVSEREDPVRIKGCNDDPAPSKCGADITAAPIVSGWKDYEEARQKSAGGGIVSFVAGVLRVHHQLGFKNAKELPPGDYIIQYWFENGNLAPGATVSGITADGGKVDVQPIPAVPSLFTESPAEQEDIAQISALKLFGLCCLWQNQCP